MPYILDPTSYASTPLPGMEEWAALWTKWDTVTRNMLPGQELHEKPIKLRNACIFYLGHIPAFLDIQLSKTTGDAPTEPAYYHSIFERGIDPDVDNPEHCHAHSETPDEWPPLADILSYQQRVRSRLQGLYRDGQDGIPRNVARAIWIGFEHEIMHMETLLYMMLQSDKTLPPPNTDRPDFEGLARQSRQNQVENQWHEVPAQAVPIGMNDPEDLLDGNGYFGWDNEKPARVAHVHGFQAKGRPITNEEYALYLIGNNMDKTPASWVRLQGPEHEDPGHTGESRADNSNLFLHKFGVRTVYGAVPLRLALDWPVFASYDELSDCAAWMGGRIPTFEEAKSIYEHVDHLKKKKDAENQLGKMVPAVNGHLSNDGVEETPPRKRAPPSQAGDGLFTDLQGANVGFQQWHPTPVLTEGARLAGQAELGGVWEWTSSALKKHRGFEPMALYPGYTADFFDGKHNIVLGGSWATHPRIAGRKSFVNWYQRNYPYAWAGARLVRDLP